MAARWCSSYCHLSAGLTGAPFCVECACYPHVCVGSPLLLSKRLVSGLTLLIVCLLASLSAASAQCSNYKGPGQGVAGVAHGLEFQIRDKGQRLVCDVFS